MTQGQLPQSVRLALQSAAKTLITQHDSLARVKAIEAVLSQARAQYPDFFIKE